MTRLQRRRRFGREEFLGQLHDRVADAFVFFGLERQEAARPSQPEIAHLAKVAGENEPQPDRARALAGFSEDMQRRNRELKDFLYKNMYNHYRVVRMAVKAERVITDLFNAYKSEPAMLPESAHKSIDKRGLERTICDYIAGMTDRFAIEEHQKLFNPLEKP